MYSVTKSVRLDFFSPRVYNCKLFTRDIFKKSVYLLPIFLNKHSLLRIFLLKESGKFSFICNCFCWPKLTEIVALMIKQIFTTLSKKIVLLTTHGFLYPLRVVIIFLWLDYESIKGLATLIKKWKAPHLRRHVEYYEMP